MRELDALRRPGRARRVDQRQDVVGLDRGDRRRRRRSRRPARSTSSSASMPSGASPSTTITCSRSGSSLRASSTLPRNACSVIRICAPASRDDVLDLVGRVGLVDRERRRPDHHRREVAEVELGPVAEHQGDRVALAQAEPRRPPASASTRSRSSPQVHEIVVALRADGDLVGAFADGDAERLGDRRGVDARAVLLLWLLLHGPQPISTGRRSPRRAAGRCRWSAR